MIISEPLNVRWEAAARIRTISSLLRPEKTGLEAGAGNSRLI
jgi:hypothetical protein